MVPVFSGPSAAEARRALRTCSAPIRQIQAKWYFPHARLTMRTLMARELHIVYDGECGFCVRSLKLVRALDVFGRLRFYDSHDPQTIQQFSQLVGANLDEAMYTVVDNEPLHEGFFAFRRLIWSSPLILLSISPFFFFLSRRCFFLSTSYRS